MKRNMDKLPTVATSERNKLKDPEEIFDKGFLFKDAEFLVEHFISLADAVCSAVCCWEIDTKLTFTNTTYDNLFSEKARPVVGQRWITALPPEERKKVKKRHGSLLKDPKVHIYKHVAFGVNGDIRHIEWTDYPIIDNDGVVKSFLSIGRDITEQVKNEDALSEIENRDAKMIKAMHDGLIVQDEYGIVTYVNDSFLKMTSCKKADVIGSSVFSLPCMDENISDILMEQFQKFGELNYKYREVNVQNQIGLTHVKVSTATIWGNKGSYKGGIAIVSDISKQKKLEMRLKKINKGLLNLGSDPSRNIKYLTSLFGEMIGSTCAIYNHLDREILHAFGRWQKPEDYPKKDRAEGHICFDVINGADEQPYVVRNLQKTDYYNTDPNVSKYNLRTYIGQPVKCGGKFVGSLCAVFQSDFVPTKDDLKVLGIISAAIGNEEDRLKSQKELQQKIDMQKLIADISSFFVGKFDINASIDKSIEKMGQLVGASRVFVFLREDDLFMSNTNDWCAEGIKKMSPNLQRLPVERYEWWIDKLQKNEIIDIRDYSELKKFALPEYKIISKLGITSLLALPIHVRGRLEGFVGFDNAGVRTWSDEDLLLLRVSSEIFGKALELEKADSELRDSVERLQSAKREWEITVDSLPHIVFLLDNSGEIVRVNKPIEDWGISAFRDVKKKNIHNILHPRCRKKTCDLKKDIESMWKRVLKGENSEMTHTSKSLKKTISIKMYPHKKNNKKKDVYAAVAVAYDVTEKVKANKKIFDMFSYLGVINRKVSILFDMRKNIAKRDIKDAHAFIAETSMQIANAKFSLIYGLNTKSKKCNLIGFGGLVSRTDKKNLKEIHVNDYDFLKKVLRSKRRMQGMQDMPLFRSFIEKHNFKDAAETILVIPLIFDEEVNGFLIFGFEKDQNISTQELEFYEFFAMQSSLILENISSASSE